MYLKDSIMNMLQGFHFRNGNITDKQLKEFKKSFRELFKLKIKYQQLIGEDATDLIEEYKQLDYKGILQAYVDNKEYFVKTKELEDKKMKGSIKRL